MRASVREAEAMRELPRPLLRSAKQQGPHVTPSTGQERGGISQAPRISKNNTFSLSQKKKNSLLHNMLIIHTWRLAAWPTSRSPSGVKATTEGVVREPSEFSITRAVLPSITATHEYVVPRSMPMMVPLASVLVCKWDGKRCIAMSGGNKRKLKGGAVRKGKQDT